MSLSTEQLQVTLFPTLGVPASPSPVTDEPECWSPKCGPTAAPVVCPDTGTVA